MAPTIRSAEATWFVSIRVSAIPAALSLKQRLSRAWDFVSVELEADGTWAHNSVYAMRFLGMEIRTSGGGMTKQAKWTFPVPPKWSMGTVKGDAFKMFRGETRELPGFLAARQPSASATLFIRELIQNSMESKAQSF